jgi:hypothetical protein
MQIQEKSNELSYLEARNLIANFLLERMPDLANPKELIEKLPISDTDTNQKILGEISIDRNVFEQIEFILDPVSGSFFSVSEHPDELIQALGLTADGALIEIGMHLECYHKIGIDGNSVSVIFALVNNIATANINHSIISTDGRKAIVENLSAAFKELIDPKTLIRKHAEYDRSQLNLPEHKLAPHFISEAPLHITTTKISGNDLEIIKQIMPENTFNRHDRETIIPDHLLINLASAFNIGIDSSGLQLGWAYQVSNQEMEAETADLSFYLCRSTSVDHFGIPFDEFSFNDFQKLGFDLVEKSDQELSHKVFDTELTEAEVQSAITSDLQNKLTYLEERHAKNLLTAAISVLMADKDLIEYVFGEYRSADQHFSKLFDHENSTSELGALIVYNQTKTADLFEMHEKIDKILSEYELTIRGYITEEMLDSKPIQVLKFYIEEWLER